MDIEKSNLKLPNSIYIGRNQNQRRGNLTLENTMTYEKFRTGLLRLFIFITILIEMKLFLLTENRDLKLDIFIFNPSQVDGFSMFYFETPTVMMITPILMVVLFKICCWIVSGFYFGKGNQKF